MTDKKRDGGGYSDLRRAIEEDKIENAYVFYGEERYLLEYCLGEIRKKLIPEGLEEFNHRRFDGKSIDVPDIAEAVDALPAFSERTLIEVWDFDMSRLSEEKREELLALLSDLPEYVCLIFVFDTAEFKLDSRIKANAQIKKLLNPVEFCLQDKSELIKWIARRFKALGKRIDRDTAEYLAFLTGGLMTRLVTEIEKTAAYIDGEAVTRSDIDAVVVPVLDAAVYTMTDAMAAGDYDGAVKVLSDLLGMNEAPHRILFSISLKLRQLMTAKVCLMENVPAGEFMEIAGIRYDFQARRTLSAARGLTLEECRRAVRLAAEAAFALNTGANGRECLSQLMLRLAVKEKAS